MVNLTGACVTTVYKKTFKPKKFAVVLEVGADCLSVACSHEIHDVLAGLCEDDLATHGAVFSQTAVPESIADCTPAQKRILCYRKLFRLFHGVGETGVKVALPSCVRAGVNIFSPDV